MKRISRNSKCLFEPFFLVKSIHGAPPAHVLHHVNSGIGDIYLHIARFDQALFIFQFESKKSYQIPSRSQFVSFTLQIKHLKIVGSFSLSLPSIMQTIHKKKGKKMFYRIKLDKGQISRKK